MLHILVVQCSELLQSEHIHFNQEQNIASKPHPHHLSCSVPHHFQPMGSTILNSVAIDQFCLFGYLIYMESYSI